MTPDIRFKFIFACCLHLNSLYFILQNENCIYFWLVATLTERANQLQVVSRVHHLFQSGFSAKVLSCFRLDFFIEYLGSGKILVKLSCIV